MAEAVEVVGQILEDRGQTHKFYAPDSSSDEELEVCRRGLEEKNYINFFMLSDVFMYTVEKNRWVQCCGTVTIFYGSGSDFC
jgi:hypothetical protein